MELRTDIGTRIALLDGAMGVMLQKAGFTEGCIEEWNLTKPEIVAGVYAAYAEAGSDIVQTNTFGANRLKLAKYGLEERCGELVSASVALARDAVAQSSHEACRVAVSVGPTGEFLYPLGAISFDEMYRVYAEIALAAQSAGADCIHFETYMDLYELRTAILAARENTDLPVSASCTFEGSHTLMGNPPEAVAALAQALGCYAVGVNCSAGPEALAPVVARMKAVTHIEVLAKPNAGIPQMKDGKTVFPMTPADMAEGVALLADAGATIIGGCCGNTPEHLRAIAAALQGRSCARNADAEEFICSPFEIRRAADAAAGLTEFPLPADPYDALDLVSECADGATVCLDCTGAPADGLPAFLAELQSVCKVPLAFTVDADCADAVLRHYCGIAGYRPAAQTDAAAVAAIAARYGAIAL